MQKSVIWQPLDSSCVPRSVLTVCLGSLVDTASRACLPYPEFKTVKSVFDTTPTDILHEIVVVDDGSSCEACYLLSFAGVQTSLRQLKQESDPTTVLDMKTRLVRQELD